MNEASFETVCQCLTFLQCPIIINSVYTACISFRLQQLLSVFLFTSPQQHGRLACVNSVAFPHFSMFFKPVELSLSSLSLSVLAFFPSALLLYSLTDNRLYNISHWICISNVNFWKQSDGRTHDYTTSGDFHIHSINLAYTAKIFGNSRTYDYTTSGEGFPDSQLKFLETVGQSNAWTLPFCGTRSGSPQLIFYACLFAFYNYYIYLVN